MEHNPYQPPAAVEAPSRVPPRAEIVRLKHVGREANIKTLGGVYIVGGIFIFAIALPDAQERSLLALGLYGIAGLATLAVGQGLLRLRLWARVAAAIPACMALIGFPVGTAVGVLVLTLLLDQKGAIVFSQRYKDVIAATPKIKCRVPTPTIILLMVTVAVISAMAFIAH